MLKKVKVFNTQTTVDKWGRHETKAVLDKPLDEWFLNTSLINFIYPSKVKDKEIWKVELAGGDFMFTEPFDL